MIRGRSFWLVALCALLAGAPARAAAESLDLGPARQAVGYRNGRPVTLSLVAIDWTEVELRTARAFLAMRAAAAQDGVALYVRSGFRSNEQQAWLHEAWRAGYGNRAARPGRSNHQSGRALDLYLDADVYRWLERNARRHGFRRTVRGEPWHWEYVKRPARRRTRG